MPQPELRRSLRTFDGVALLIGITIGSGIYSTPSLVAGYFTSFASDIATWIAVGLFVRQSKTDDRGMTMLYLFLGPVR